MISQDPGPQGPGKIKKEKESYKRQAASGPAISDNMTRQAASFKRHEKDTMN